MTAKAPPRARKSATKPAKKRSTPAEKAGAALRERALAYPETREDFPWGESVVKVRGKVFIFLGHHAEGGGLSLSVKLPHSNEMALMLPFASPTGYGLSKSGWVSARFAAADKPPLPMLLEWLDESYRAVAPAKLVRTLTAPGTEPPAERPARAAGKSAAASPARRRRRA